MALDRDRSARSEAEPYRDVLSQQVNYPVEFETQIARSVSKGSNKALAVKVVIVSAGETRVSFVVRNRAESVEVATLREAIDRYNQYP